MEERGHDHDDDQSSYMDEEEQIVFQRIINSFKAYKSWALHFVRRAEHDFSHLSDRHKRLIPKCQEKVAKSKICIDINEKFVQQILPIHNLFENQDIVCYILLEPTTRI